MSKLPRAKDLFGENMEVLDEHYAKYIAQIEREARIAELERVKKFHLKKSEKQKGLLLLNTIDTVQYAKDRIKELESE